VLAALLTLVLLLFLPIVLIDFRADARDFCASIGALERNRALSCFAWRDHGTLALLHRKVYPSAATFFVLVLQTVSADKRLAFEQVSREPNAVLHLARNTRKHFDAKQVKHYQQTSSTFSSAA
jgi:hypothetical protein